MCETIWEIVTTKMPINCANHASYIMEDLTVCLQELSTLCFIFSHFIYFVNKRVWGMGRRESGMFTPWKSCTYTTWSFKAIFVCLFCFLFFCFFVFCLLFVFWLFFFILTSQIYCTSIKSISNQHEVEDPLFLEADHLNGSRWIQKNFNILNVVKSYRHRTKKSEKIKYGVILVSSFTMISILWKKYCIANCTILFLFQNNPRRPYY